MADTVLISLDEVKDEIGVQVTDDSMDDILQAMANEVSSLWEELTERKWEETLYTERHDGKRGQKIINVKNYPITVLTSVHVNTDWIFDQAHKLDAVDLTFDSDSGAVYYDGTFDVGFKCIQVIYTAGYVATTVPLWLKLILKRQIAHWHRQRTGNTSDLFSVSIHAGGGTTSYKSLKDNLLPDFAAAADRHRRIGY